MCAWHRYNERGNSHHFLSSPVSLYDRVHSTFKHFIYLLFLLHTCLSVVACVYEYSTSVYNYICLPSCTSFSLHVCHSNCLSACPPTCLPVCLSVCISIWLSFRLQSTCLAACQFIVCLLVFLCAWLSVCSAYMCVSLPVCLYVCLFNFCLSVQCPSVGLSVCAWCITVRKKNFLHKETR
jgi:hypothetical protein